MRRLGISLVALGAAALAASSAGAATLPLTLQVGGTYTFELDGTPGGTTKDNTGLYATIQLTYTGLSADKKEADFGYVVKNLSTVTSRLSAFGFSTTPNVANTGSSGTGAFGKIVPRNNLGGASIEMCASGSAGSGNNCTGGGGLSGAPTTASGTLALVFASAITSLSLDGLFVKWQDLVRGGSAVGNVFNITTYVPPEGGNTPVPGPIAGAGIPALLAAGAFLWTRRRKVAE